ncbi:MAG: Ig-like domain-containing protein [Fimbriimonas sp.]
MKALLVAATLMASLHAWAAVEIKVNANDGDSLVGERAFRVTVTAKSAVTSVEFYVGDDLRDSDTSTPYEFRFDSLMEKDGPLVVKFKAYTTDGESAEKTLRLNVSNGLDKGAEFHIQRAIELLQSSKWDEAITAGRVALKIDSNSNPARIVMARANFGKGVLDTAQKFAEDALAADANNTEAADLLSAINLKRAFGVVSRSTDRNESLNLIRTALTSAVQARRKVLDAAVDQYGTPTEAKLIPFLDAAIRAGRFSLVIQSAEKAFRANPKRADIANRLAFAQLRADRSADALATLLELQKTTALDAYGYALLGAIYIQRGDDKASDDAMREAVLAESDNPGVLTAQAFIALKRNRTAVLTTLSQNLLRDQGQKAEVSYFISALANRRNDFQVSRRYFERGVLAEPAFAEIYIEQANESISLALGKSVEAKEKQFQFDSARTYYLAAIEARSSSDSLVGLTIVSLLSSKPSDALRYAQAAVAANPNSAAAQYALAGALSANRQSAQALQANLKAGQLDKKNLEGRQIPNGEALWRYFTAAGRPVVLTAPK